MSAFLVTLAVGVGSYVSRSLFILALARKRLEDERPSGAYRE